MKITSVTPILLGGDETYGSHDGAAEATDQGDRLLLVRVATDEGLVGWSDVETLGSVAVQVLSGTGMGALGFRTLAEELVGKDPLEPERLWDELYLATAYYGRRGVVMHAMSAVDNCLWSIRAQAAGVDLAASLGGRRRDRLPAYASTLFRSTPDDNAQAASRYASLGFHGVKFGWGGFGVDPARDRDNLAAIRAGATRGLRVDGRPRMVRTRRGTGTHPRPRADRGDAAHAERGPPVLGRGLRTPRGVGDLPRVEAGLPATSGSRRASSSPPSGTSGGSSTRHRSTYCSPICPGAAA